MQKERKDKHFIKKPIYEGGPKAMKAFIGKHMRYPKEAMENKTEGTVHIKFDINHLGEVTDTKIISGLGHGCDEEAARLVKLLKFQVPKNRGVRVIFHKTLQIHFRLPQSQPTLPKSRPQQAAGQFVYQVVPTSKPQKKEPPKKPKEKTYSYTIKF